MNKQELAKQLSTAITLAATGHMNQFDKGGNPYILHPLAVMQFAKDAGDDIEILIACVLHDWIEDTKGTYKQLVESGINERSVAAVKAVTKVPGETTEEYEAKILANPDAIRVKLHDLRHNTDIRRLKGVSQKDMDRMEKYFHLYVKLTAALQTMST